VSITKPEQKHKYNIKTVPIHKKRDIKQIKQNEYGSSREKNKHKRSTGTNPAKQRHVDYNKWHRLAQNLF
jgi:hypothetical protein